jgi:hypothetical protein
MDNGIQATAGIGRRISSGVRRVSSTARERATQIPIGDRQNGADAEAREYSNQARTDVTRGVGRLNELDEGACDCDWPGNVPEVNQKVQFGLGS